MKKTTFKLKIMHYLNIIPESYRNRLNLLLREGKFIFIKLNLTLIIQKITGN